MGDLYCILMEGPDDVFVEENKQSSSSAFSLNVIMSVIRGGKSISGWQVIK